MTSGSVVRHMAPGILPGAIFFLALSAATGAAADGARVLPGTGAVDARVQVIIVNEFGCPTCRRGKLVAEQLLLRYPDTVRTNFLHNPRPAFPMSLPAARAAVAAANQGRFWAFHDRLFSLPTAVTGDALETVAEELAREDGNFSLEQWRADRASPQTEEQVQQQRSVALATGATATPSYFVNGRLLTGNVALRELVPVVEQELAAAAAADAGGDEWLHQRLAANNPELHRFLFEGETPTREFLEARRLVTDITPGTGQRVVRALPMPADVRYPVPVHDDDPVRGTPDAPVTVVEFSDFQCPSCRRLAPILRQLLKRHPGDVRLVFKQEPLGYHPQARQAAVASLCAHEQGAFWSMHDRLFEGGLSEAQLEAHARAIGLDMEGWSRCMTADRHAQRIARDTALARKVGANGTPYTFINGRRVAGVRSTDWFSAVVRQEVREARELLDAGVDPGEVYSRLIAEDEPDT